MGIKHKYVKSAAFWKTALRRYLLVGIRTGKSVMADHSETTFGG